MFAGVVKALGDWSERADGWHHFANHDSES